MVVLLAPFTLFCVHPFHLLGRIYITKKPEHEEYLERCEKLEEQAKKWAEKASERATKQAETDAMTTNFTDAAVIGEFWQVLGLCSTKERSNGGRIEVAHAFTSEGDPCNIQRYKISRSKVNMKYATISEQTFYQCKFINGQLYYYAN